MRNSVRSESLRLKRDLPHGVGHRKRQINNSKSLVRTNTNQRWTRFRRIEKWIGHKPAREQKIIRAPVLRLQLSLPSKEEAGLLIGVLKKLSNRNSNNSSSSLADGQIYRDITKELVAQQHSKQLPWIKAEQNILKDKFRTQVAIKGANGVETKKVLPSTNISNL